MSQNNVTIIIIIIIFIIMTHFTFNVPIDMARDGESCRIVEQLKLINKRRISITKKQSGETTEFHVLVIKRNNYRLLFKFRKCLNQNVITSCLSDRHFTIFTLFSTFFFSSVVGHIRSKTEN